MCGKEDAVFPNTAAARVTARDPTEGQFSAIARFVFSQRMMYLGRSGREGVLSKQTYETCNATATPSVGGANRIRGWPLVVSVIYRL